VRDHDYERFYREEIRHRRELGYPPFGELARAVVSGEDPGVTAETAERLAACAREALGTAPDCEILGPAPAPLARLRGRHRLQILVKGADATAVMRAARAIAGEAPRLRAPLQASVDVAPMHML
jgi:primosomal protein N' (replication factor Y)